MRMSFPSDMDMFSGWFGHMGTSDKGNLEDGINGDRHCSGHDHVSEMTLL